MILYSKYTRKKEGSAKKENAYYAIVWQFLAYRYTQEYSITCLFDILCKIKNWEPAYQICSGIWSKCGWSSSKVSLIRRLTHGEIALMHVQGQRKAFWTHAMMCCSYALISKFSWWRSLVAPRATCSASKSRLLMILKFDTSGHCRVPKLY